MISLWKHIEGPQAAEAVPRKARQEAAEVADERLRIAGEVRQPHRTGGEHRRERLRVQPRARRIDDDELRLRGLEPEAAIHEHRFHVPDAEFDVLHAIERGVQGRQFHMARLAVDAKHPDRESTRLNSNHNSTSYTI